MNVSRSSWQVFVLALALQLLAACRSDEHLGKNAEDRISWFPAWELTTAERDRYLFPRIAADADPTTEPRCVTPSGSQPPPWLLEVTSEPRCTTPLRALVDSRSSGASGPDGQALLTVAALCGRTDAVERLLASGVKVDTHDPCGWTALVAAVTTGRGNTLRLLLEAGADPNLATGQGSWTRSPLLAALIRGDERAATALLKAGADANTATKQGRTALMFAAATGREDLVRSLLQHGASPCPSDDRGLTATEAATSHGAHDSSALLQMAELRECGRSTPR